MVAAAVDGGVAELSMLFGIIGDSFFAMGLLLGLLFFLLDLLSSSSLTVGFFLPPPATRFLLPLPPRALVVAVSPPESPIISKADDFLSSPDIVSSLLWYFLNSFLSGGERSKARIRSLSAGAGGIGLQGRRVILRVGYSVSVSFF